MQNLLNELRLRAIRTLALVVGAVLLTGCLGSPSVSDADNDQVITLGDSIFDFSGEIQKNLESFAGQTFRKYTKSGAEIEGGSIALSVYGQYAEALADNPNIDTIVMNGGGNDILIPAILFDPYNCRVNWWEFGRLSRSCRNLISDIYVSGVNLLNDMAADGVDNVIYLGYYYPTNKLSNLRQAVDHGDSALFYMCQNSVVNCTFIDSRAYINNRDVLIDNIHPTSSGSLKLANLIWPKLQPLL